MSQKHNAAFGIFNSHQDAENAVLLKAIEHIDLHCQAFFKEHPQELCIEKSGELDLKRQSLDQAPECAEVTRILKSQNH